MPQRTAINGVRHTRSCLMPGAGLLPQMQISVETFMNGQFLQSRKVHEFACFLKELTFNILFGLDCSLSCDPTLYKLVFRNELPLLFWTLIVFFVGLSEWNFAIQIVVTGPVIARRFRGRNWIELLCLLLIRSARHRGLSETQIKICQAQIKIMAIILLQELQSSVRPGPKILAGGRPPTEKWAVQ
jgi:hypothetical protein